MSDTRTFGIDVGGSSIKWAALDGSRLTANGSIETPRSDHLAVIDAMASIVREHWPHDGAVGVAVPGTVRPRDGRTIFVPNLPGHWADFAVADELTARCDRPVHLINDARAFAWAELADGAARGAVGALSVTIGTGIGGAIAHEGRIVIGELDAIGELGHVPVEPEGEHCVCGGRGCLETVASASAIAARLARTVATSQSPILRQPAGRRAQPGDREAGLAGRSQGRPLGCGRLRESRTCARPGSQHDLPRASAGYRRDRWQHDAAADLLLPRLQEALDSRRSAWFRPDHGACRHPRNGGGGCGSSSLRRGPLQIDDVTTEDDEMTWIDEARRVLDRIERTQTAALDEAASITPAEAIGGGVVHTLEPATRAYPSRRCSPGTVRLPAGIRSSSCG